MSKISVIYNKISKTLIKIKNRSLLQPQKVPKVQHLYFNFQLICNPCHKDYKTLDNIILIIYLFRELSQDQGCGTAPFIVTAETLISAASATPVCFNQWEQIRIHPVRNQTAGYDKKTRVRSVVEPAGPGLFSWSRSWWKRLRDTVVAK